MRYPEAWGRRVGLALKKEMRGGWMDGKQHSLGMLFV